jgi:uncharacterized protein YndB with AHSA1/START domain
MNQMLRLHITLPVAPSAVYQAITNSSSLQNWLTERSRVSLSNGVFELWGRYLPGAATVEPRPGGKYDFGWGENGPIKILELEPDRKLTYSWHHDTVVSWILEDSEGGTRINLVHSGFAKDRSTDDYTAGWWKFVNYLKSMVEIGDSWQEVQVETNVPCV